MGAYVASVGFAELARANRFLEKAREVGADATLILEGGARHYVVTVLGKQDAVAAALREAEEGTLLRHERVDR